jgi:hypothetical protein
MASTPPRHSAVRVAGSKQGATYDGVLELHLDGDLKKWGLANSDGLDLAARLPIHRPARWKLTERKPHMRGWRRGSFSASAFFAVFSGTAQPRRAPNCCLNLGRMAG